MQPSTYNSKPLPVHTPRNRPSFAKTCARANTAMRGSDPARYRTRSGAGSIGYRLVGHGLIVPGAAVPAGAGEVVGGSK